MSLFLTCTKQSPILITYNGVEIVLQVHKIKRKEGEVRMEIKAPKEFKIYPLFNPYANKLEGLDEKR